MLVNMQDYCRNYVAKMAFVGYAELKVQASGDSYKSI